MVVVVSSIASAVRTAAEAAGIDEHSIDVLPFPTRQWRPVFVDQLAAIAQDVLGTTPALLEPRTAIAELPAGYERTSDHLHDAIAVVLRRHPNEWVPPRVVAKEIA